MADITVTNHGTIFTFVGETDSGSEWLADHLPEDCPMMGGAYCVEHRYARDIAKGAQADGLDVE